MLVAEATGRGGPAQLDLLELPHARLPADGQPRIAWIVEYRAAELTDEERQLVRDATTQMLSALEHDTDWTGRHHQQTNPMLKETASLGSTLRRPLRIADAARRAQPPTVAVRG